MNRILLALIAASLIAQAAPPPKNALLVLSKGDLVLSIVDPVSLKVLATAPSGPDPHEVVASADGKFAYISNYGGGQYNTITVVDLIAQKTVDTVDLGGLHGPHGLWFSGGKVWFTAEPNKAVATYNPATRKVDWVLGTGQDRTHMVLVANDQKRFYTTNVTSASVSVIEQAGAGRGGVEWKQTVIPVGKGAEGFDVTPDGKELWTANAADGTVSVIDIATRKVVQTLAVAVNGANRLKFTPDGKHAFISTLSGSETTILDTATRAVVKRLPTGRAAGIEMQPDGTRVFIACTPENYVAIVDLKTLEITGRLEAGKNPDGMIWSGPR